MNMYTFLLWACSLFNCELKGYEDLRPEIQANGLVEIAA